MRHPADCSECAEAQLRFVWLVRGLPCHRKHQSRRHKGFPLLRSAWKSQRVGRSSYDSSLGLRTLGSPAGPSSFFTSIREFVPFPPLLLGVLFPHLSFPGGLLSESFLPCGDTLPIMASPRLVLPASSWTACRLFFGFRPRHRLRPSRTIRHRFGRRGSRQVTSILLELRLVGYRISDL